MTRTYDFKDFKAALAFVNLVGESAERAGHHPAIDIRYNRARLALVTHDAGGLTEIDFDLAADLNRVAWSFPQIFFLASDFRGWTVPGNPKIWISWVFIGLLEF